MANIDDYQRLEGELNAIRQKEVNEPNMPVDVAIQEAENLYEWCQEDKPLLQKAGLDISIIDTIPVRAGACRYTQSLWMKEFNNRQQEELEWKNSFPHGFELHKKLIHFFRYAYRNDNGILMQVNKIAEGSSHADMIQDLSDLALLGKAHPEQLQNVGLDMAELDRAENMSDYLGSLLAKANGKKGSQNQTKDLRDRAFTYLKKAVDEVRECGKFVFWQNEARLKGYRSAYFRKRTHKSQKAEITN